MVRFDPETLPAEALAQAKAGARIGLLGGSFNPAHGAHLHVSLIAVRRLKLDSVWWLVSPQNPLKDASELAPLERRVAHARDAVDDHPDIHVTTVETALGLRFTVDTIKALKKNFKKARFVWLMGSDNLAEFHRWRRWQEIAALVPIAVIARPRFTTRALASPAAQQLRETRRKISEAPQLADMTPPAWVFIQERLDPTSSTALRAKGVWR